jgi:hypothetical protein
VPFDIVLLSRVYHYYYVIAGRRSFQNKIRSHIYPTSVSDFPWNNLMAEQASELTRIRTALLSLCQRRFELANSLRLAADKLGMQPLRVVARALSGATIGRSEDFDVSPELILEIVTVPFQEDGVWCLPVDGDGRNSLKHALLFNNAELAMLAHAGLSLRDGEEMTYNAILNASVPINREMAEQLTRLIAEFDNVIIEQKIDEQISEIDEIVGPALGLSSNEVKYIEGEMASDPFLSQVKPRFPFFRPRLRGRIAGLDAADRYRR